MRVLIVDDSKAVHGYLTDCFKKTSCQIDHAYNGQEAWLKLSAPGGAELYGAVLLDWEMPIMTGPELLTKIKNNKFSVPVIMMTSKNAEMEIAQMLEAGALEYIMKPFTQDIVFEKLEVATGQKVGQNES